MKKRNGFTLIELLICFVLVTIISITLFKTVLSLQEKQKKAIIQNEYKAFALVLNNSIKKDFTTKKVTSFISCGTNCYDITYESEVTNRLTIDKTSNIINYGSISEKLPKNYMFYDDIEVNAYQSYDSTDSKYYKYITINFPIKNKTSVGNDDIKYMYIYEDDITLSL